MCIDTDTTNPSLFRGNFHFYQGANASFSNGPLDGNTHNSQGSVGMMTGIDERGSLFSCSGVLIRNIAIRSLFLTANHCVPTDAVANTIEVFWHYSAPWCGRKTKALDLVKRSIGARLIRSAASSDGDWSLLELKSVPPSAVYAGWTDRLLEAGFQGWSLHHANGDGQRLALLRKELDQEGVEIEGRPVRPGRFMLFSTTNGAIQPGSSGSPMFDGGGRVVGLISASTKIDRCGATQQVAVSRINSVKLIAEDELLSQGTSLTLGSAYVRGEIDNQTIIPYVNVDGTGEIRSPDLEVWWNDVQLPKPTVHGFFEAFGSDVRNLFEVISSQRGPNYRPLPRSAAIRVRKSGGPFSNSVPLVFHSRDTFYAFRVRVHQVQKGNDTIVRVTLPSRPPGEGYILIQLPQQYIPVDPIEMKPQPDLTYELTFPGKRAYELITPIRVIYEDNS